MDDYNYGSLGKTLKKLARELEKREKELKKLFKYMQSREKMLFTKFLDKQTEILPEINTSIIDEHVFLQESMKNTMFTLNIISNAHAAILSAENHEQALTSLYLTKLLLEKASLLLEFYNKKESIFLKEIIEICDEKLDAINLPEEIIVKTESNAAKIIESSLYLAEYTIKKNTSYITFLPSFWSKKVTSNVAV